MNRFITYLIALFLIVCIGVHVAGFFVHVSNEGMLSHVIHLISYSLLLLAFLRPVKFRLLLYCIGFIYPFCYHANCFFVSMLQQHHFNSICFDVIFVLPIAGIMILQQETKK